MKIDFLQQQIELKLEKLLSEAVVMNEISSEINLAVGTIKIAILTAEFLNSIIEESRSHLDKIIKNLNEALYRVCYKNDSVAESLYHAKANMCAYLYLKGLKNNE
jgi:hypothetical protein